MTHCAWESIDVHLLRVLHALLTECSVSRAARRLNQSQPAVSTALRRLRDMTGDPLLVRSRSGMTPTERGASLLEPVRIALQQIESIALQQVHFDPAKSRRLFNVATPDYLSADLFGDIVGRLRRLAPHTQLALQAFGAGYDYVQALECGELDLVVANWPQPPEHLRTTTLFEDELVCVMRLGHPLSGGRMSLKQYLEAEHLVQTPDSVGQRGVIDLHLARERLRRNVVASVPHCHLVPHLLLRSDMIFTGPRMFAEHYMSFLPFTLAPLPTNCPAVSYYLLWHERNHYGEEARWFRDQFIQVARSGVAPEAGGRSVVTMTPRRQLAVA